MSTLRKVGLAPRRGVHVVLFAAALAALLLIAPAAPAAGPCPNVAIREAQKSATLPEGSTFLPACMALEMVSPPKKFNQGAGGANFSADGERIEFGSLAALGETTSLPSLENRYVATRGPSGWSTQSLQAPADITVGYDLAARPCGYTPDLSHWVTWGTTTPLAQVAINTPYRGTLGGSLSPLGPTLAPLSGGLDNVGGEFTIRSGDCEGASADAKHLFFKLFNVTYFAGDPEVEAAKDGIPFYFANTYEAYLDAKGTPSLRLLQRDRDGTVYGGRCGARIGDASGGSNIGTAPRSRGAVSGDASRVYFLARPSQAEGIPCNASVNRVRIMKRLETPTGPVISELTTPSECERVAPPCSAIDGDDEFLGASQEGTEVFFTSVRQLADSDEDTTKDLYLYDTEAPAGEHFTQVSAGEPSAPTPGAGAQVLGLPDFAGDGSRAYFVAEGVLTTAANEAGDSAQAGQPNLYLYDATTGHTALVGTLSPTDDDPFTSSPLWGRAPGETNAAMAVPRLGPDVEDQTVGGDGHIFVFNTRAALNPSDSDGGEPDLYRYDSESGSLQWVSAAAPGGSDDGPFPVTGTSRQATPGGQSVSFGAWVSEDGEKIIFETAEALDPTDTNGEANAYLWDAGQLTAIPFGTNAKVSLSGREVGFTSRQQLLPEDGDATADVYVARSGGGFPIVVPPPPCTGEVCQGPASPRPGDLGGASEALRSGNPPATKPCRKGYVKKRGNCRPKPPGRHKPKQRKNKQKKSAGHKQGGQK